MTLPATGAISLSQINTELGKPSNSQISFGDTSVKTLLGLSTSGTVPVPINVAHGKTYANFILTAGYSAPLSLIGYLQGSMGSVSSTFKGAVINQCTLQTGTYKYFSIIVNGIYPRAFFNTITINGVTFNTADPATTYYAISFNNLTTWSWSTTMSLANGGVYPVTST